jgi:hypothetical protein
LKCPRPSLSSCQINDEPMSPDSDSLILVPAGKIAQLIFLVRGHRVMLDRDLASLYGVETRVLNQAVRRNLERFPADFLFSLTRPEVRNISQIVTRSSGKARKKSGVQRLKSNGCPSSAGVLWRTGPSSACLSTRRSSATKDGLWRTGSLKPGGDEGDRRRCRQPRVA